VVAIETIAGCQGVCAGTVDKGIRVKTANQSYGSGNRSLMRYHLAETRSLLV
jgi:hypothetical protein